MERIGVRELRREASRWLARVRAGETFLITDRGRPVARLTPITVVSGYASMVASGDLAVGTARPLELILEELDEQLPPPAAASASTVLEDLRRGER